MGRLSEVWSCEACGAAVPKVRAQLHINSKRTALAWDHRVFSDGACTHYSPMRNTESALVEESAHFASALNRNGSARQIRVVDTGDSVAYAVRTVDDLLWIAANVVAPVGFEPQLTLPLMNVGMSTILCQVPLGVRHREGEDSEFLHLRLAIGDWLLVSREHESVMRRVSDDDLRSMLTAAGHEAASLREVWSERNVS